MLSETCIDTRVLICLKKKLAVLAGNSTCLFVRSERSSKKPARPE